MLDTCIVRRATGKSARDDATGLSVPVYEDLFTSRCKVSGKSAADPSVRTVDVGGVERPYIEAGVHLPLSANPVPEGAEIKVTAIGPLTDPMVLGARYRVVGFGGKSWATARRLDVAFLGIEEV